MLGTNPLLPQHCDPSQENPSQRCKPPRVRIKEGIYEIGHEDAKDFCYDNELGRHTVYLHDYSISNKLITNAEYLDFIDAGGYKYFNLWHAEGWDWVKQNQIEAPMYWHKIEGH